MKVIQRITRWLILILMLNEVRSESGIWTASAIGMIFIIIEVQGYIVARWTNEIHSIILSSHEPREK